MTYLLNNIILNSFSFCILVTLCIYAFDISKTKAFHNKLYIFLIILMMSLVVFDTMSRFDGLVYAFYPTLNIIGNFMLFILSPLVPSTWVLFVYNYIYRPERQSRHILVFLFFVNLIHSLLVVVSLKTGWLYYIDSNNIYHRGRYYFTNPLIFIIFVFVAAVIIFVNRKRIDRKQYNALLIFIIPAFLAIFLQVYIPGVSFMLSGTTLSMLIVLLYTQNQMVENDYLSGVYNRRSLEIYLSNRIKLAKTGFQFGAIMLDLDDFKKINDQFGHAVGDEAIKDTIGILSKCTRENDYIARYGGDEFCIIINNVDWRHLLFIINRINQQLDEFNNFSDKPYQLHLSMGYDLYQRSTQYNADDFLKHLDNLMYQQKSNNIDPSNK